MTKSEPARKHKYSLRFHPEALAEWQSLDGSVKETMRKLLKKRLDNPHVPGSALRRDLAGFYKIKLLKQGIRLVYGVEDEALIVLVMTVDKREDGIAYRSAVARIAASLALLAPPGKDKSKA